MKINFKIRAITIAGLFLFVMGSFTAFASLKLDSSGNVLVGSSSVSSGTKGVLNVYGTTAPALYCQPGAGAAISAESTSPYTMLNPVLYEGKVANSGMSFVKCYLNGTLQFSVTGSGQICGQGIVTPSDSVLKENIRTLSSPLEKVMRLRGVSYDLKASREGSTLKESSGDEEALTEEESSVRAIRRQMDAESRRPRLGLIAQEVETVVPEVVYTTLDGKKGVAYSELISLLIEAVKEQQSKIEELETRVEALTGVVESLPENEMNSIENTTAKHSRSAALLYQNIPNPFNSQTRIRYYLPADIVSASLRIYNLQGKQLDYQELTVRGESFVELPAARFEAGMYIYALIADGKEVDSKRMIITE